eukprot:3941578-Pleurochrysis_carterae.AAC.1
MVARDRPPHHSAPCQSRSSAPTPCRGSEPPRTCAPDSAAASVAFSASSRRIVANLGVSLAGTSAVERVWRDYDGPSCLGGPQRCAPTLGRGGAALCGGVSPGRCAEGPRGEGAARPRALHFTRLRAELARLFHRCGRAPCDTRQASPARRAVASPGMPCASTPAGRMASAIAASTVSAPEAHPLAAARKCATSAARTCEPSSDGRTSSVHRARVLRHVASASSSPAWSRATSSYAVGVSALLAASSSCVALSGSAPCSDAQRTPSFASAVSGGTTLGWPPHARSSTALESGSSLCGDDSVASIPRQHSVGTYFLPL